MQRVMKEKLLKVCVLGNFSGRNAGDNAILGGVLKDISSQYTDILFIVPTINPAFIKNNFREYWVQTVSLQPWSLSLKIFGLPIFRSVLSSDLVLVTDNILFDRKLFNPVFNYLSTLSLVLPLARRKDIPVILYNMSLGPVNTRIGSWCFERVSRSCRHFILRDAQSAKLLNRFNVPGELVEMGADCALNTDPSPDGRIEEIVASEGLFQNERGTIGFNVNTYLDAYLKRGGRKIDRESFLSLISQAVDCINVEMGLDVLFFVTQVMDHKITMDVLQRVNNPGQVKLISNRVYSYRDITGLMGKLELMVGMRTHALILASSMNIPVVGIISYPKTAGYLASIQQEKWTINFEDLDSSSLFTLFQAAYLQRTQIRSELAIIIQEQKEIAIRAARSLHPFLVGHNRFKLDTISLSN